MTKLGAEEVDLPPAAVHDGTAFATTACTAAALCGFAANSLLCRLALASSSVDAVTFTAVRVVAGAVMLALVAAAAGRRDPRRAQTGAAGARRAWPGTWLGASALFAYAIAFSFAYLQLSAGTGALVLFGAVQVTMIGHGVVRGERPHPREWAGLAIAAAGLVALNLHGATAPDARGFAAMTLAGVAWAVYSLHGRGVRRPLLATSGNFARAVPLAVVASLIATQASSIVAHATAVGVLLAVASGAVASGLGYAVWYKALPRLTATRAATVQLAVPVVTAAAGVVLLGEQISLRLLLAGAAILGGIALAVVPPRRRPAR